MALILPPARTDDLFSAVANQIEPAKIIEDSDAASTDYLETFFRECAIPARKVVHSSLRAVGEAKGNQHFAAGVARVVADMAGRDFADRSAGKKHQQINEVAGFAAKPAAPLLGIVEPVVGRERGKIGRASCS